MISESDLNQIMTELDPAKAEAYFPFLQQALEEFEITTPLREAAFIAQVAHESGEFKWMEEIWGPTDAQKRYEPPNPKAKELGNIQAGDGKRYKGRGPIQITGRGNYKKYGEMLGVDLEGDPDSAASPGVAFRVAAAYWKTHGLNEVADQGEGGIELITRRINGGTLGLQERIKYYKRAKAVLGV